MSTQSCFAALRHTFAHSSRVLGILALAGGLSACAQNQTLYAWGSYQPMVYSYLKDEGADYAAQAQAMEENLEAARASSKTLPPGFRAHLGLLYLKTGEGAKAAEMWQGEKLAFPESGSFMNFLMRHISDGQTQAQQSTDEDQKG
ncbi:DUF4810 domain-containing protein [Paracandidimonas soli]|uniref:DUF4810 domain-containing protein n=1 Tax=Paracandidimonas soli TaxID=1917182 RepID=A0A4R3VCL4_9BURK|nr:DUF4810 domain-containing protein [Paracandidimonas soli]TCV03067.1 hypothetical protein EV686_101529 [Paracandidimonas soli]